MAASDLCPSCGGYGIHTIGIGTERVEEELYWIAEGWVANRLPSAYFQDSWDVGRRLHINMGLRWDGQYFVGSDGTVAQTITDQWQPRIGFTYQPGRLGTQKIYGS